MKDSGNTKKILNYLLFVFTLLAGVVWWGIGEFFFAFAKADYESIIRNPLLNGVYFAFLTLFTITACLLSEKIVHSIVDEEFFIEAVMTPSLTKILPLVFAVMLLASGVMEFIYEIEITPSAPVKITKPTKPIIAPTPTPPKAEVLPIDYYFLLDNTTSLEYNDPNKERIKLLEKIVKNFPDDRKIALISFGEKATIHIRPEYATDQIKKQFINTIKKLVMIDGTNIKSALTRASSVLINDYSRKEVIIFITDGEDIYGFTEYSYDFKRVLQPFITANVPIYSIFLNTDNVDSNFLKSISSLTGGKYSTVKNPVDLESEITKVIETEEEDAIIIQPQPGPIIHPGRVQAKDPLRDMLDVRMGRRQNSILYAIMHIAFITIIGLLMGYSLFMVFSSGRIFLSLLIGGGISGLLAGIILEVCFQLLYLPDYLNRLLACIVLSTVIWFISFISARITGLITGRTVFALWETDNDDDRTNGRTDERSDMSSNVLDSNQSKNIDNGVLDSEEKNNTKTSQGRFCK